MNMKIKSISTLHLVVLSTVWTVESIACGKEDGDLDYGYSRKNGKILFDGQQIDQAGRQDVADFAKTVGRPLIFCKSLDAASFVALSEEYTKDKNRVYYKWISPGRFWVVELVGADPATFEVLDFELARDHKRVWKRDEPVDGADPLTAEVIRPHSSWKDKSRVYYQSKVVAGADPATFRHLGQGFYRDANRVYWCDVPMPEADPESFKACGEELPYARDRNQVWSASTALVDVDARSFEHVYEHVYRDSKHVYVGTTALEVLHADASTFVKVATLQPEKFAMFRDRARYYVYDSNYVEFYLLERMGGAVVVSKPVWHSPDARRKAVHGATVSAKLEGGRLSDPRIALQPGFENEAYPVWEKEKLRFLTRVFLEAEKHMAK